MRHRLAVLALVILMLCNLAVGQKKVYQPPAPQTPPVYRADETLQPGAQSLGDLQWFEVFKDEQLQVLIRTAIFQNYDVRQAMARINAARAQLGLARADQYPNFAVSSNITTQRLSKDGSTGELADGAQRNISFGQVLLNLLNFEIDIWGRVRKIKNARRAELKAAEEDRSFVLATVVSATATGYFQLRELDLELEIARRTLATREESLRIIRLRTDAGLATALDLRQAEQLVYSARATIPDMQRAIEQQENLINLLLGQNPAPIPRGRELVAQELTPTVPPGLPSTLLQRRPDIRSAEQTLVAANYSVEAARAAYFPRISLTGFLGGDSTALSSLFAGAGSVWGFAPQLTQPIFTAGRLKSNVKLNKAQQESAIIGYQSTVQGAFREVSDALVAYRKTVEVRVEQELLVQTLKERSRLAYLRYEGGVDSLLNALDADRDYFEAQIGLAQIKLDELTAVVQLYRALGGGWQV
ncbi:MAG TPA: efflux transporter outer membrane subunit [Pyrinomonadaceae bacterium]|nr:efflux transporter outer membrane subunit [Pyrinomonadaceae bacterium]